MRRSYRAASWVIIGAVGLMGLAGCAETQMASKPSLYQRLGGKDAITAVVDTFVSKVAADNRINKFFASTDIPKLKMHLVNQVCEATGGPCKYTGRTMKATHAGMGLTNADFDALVQDLAGALDAHRVSKAEKDELLAALGPMRSDIVER